jgi:transglutaminase-like putative cysteine protease
MSKDLGAAWRAFSFKVAPVPELPGLVLATAWAAGAAGLLSELLSSRRRIPAVFALMPALGIYLFAAALGTDSWRVLGLASIAAAGCWYLVATVRERDTAQDVLIASPDAALTVGDRAASYSAGAVVLRVALLAALAAAVIGPNLPGARSEALVSWHGKGRAGTGPGTTVVQRVSLRGVQISTLVQAAEEEVNDKSVALFTVYGAIPTREVIAIDDSFNGNSWTPLPVVSPTQMPAFDAPLRRYESNPPAPVPDGAGSKTLVQVIQVSDLGGRDMPRAGFPEAVANISSVSREGSSGDLISRETLRPTTVYAVLSKWADPSPAELEAITAPPASSEDLNLRQPVPSSLKNLAHSIVTKATANTAYAKAIAIEDYFLRPSSGFVYRLPTRAQLSHLAKPAPGYRDLLQFIQDKKGYCQQFAAAFAVLARIEGLPTRIAVGFLEGTKVGKDAWLVDGSEIHSWPQVLFGRYGWINFDPTPGAPVGDTTVPPPSTTTTVPLGATGTTVRKPPGVRPALSGGVTHLGSTRQGTRHRSSSSSAPWLLVVPFAALAWAGGVPIWRRLRLRRAGREPRAGILAAWSEALRTLDLAGVRRRRAETYLELARRVALTGVLSEEASLALGDLARLATSASYAASPPESGGTRQAMSSAKTVIRSARRRVARWQRVAAALDPRGLPA